MSGYTVSEVFPMPAEPKDDEPREVIVRHIEGLKSDLYALVGMISAGYGNLMNDDDLREIAAGVRFLRNYRSENLTQ